MISNWFTSELLFAQLWQVTLLICVVATANIWIRKRNPHLATLLWLVVLVKCVTPPVWSSPASFYSWIQPRVQSANDEFTTNNAPMDSEGIANIASLAPQNIFVPNDLNSSEKNNLAISGKKPFWARKNQTESPDASATSAFNLLPSNEITDPPRQPFPWIKLWLYGIFAACGLVCIRYLVFWQRIKRTAKRDRRLEIVARKLARKLNVRRAIRVWVTDSQIGPAIVGFFRPVIVLPAVIVEAKSHQEIEPILAHEINHLRRGDIWFSAMQLGVTCCWWFHPLVWLINRAITRDIERCCDESTIARLGYLPADYAHCLVDVLQIKNLKPVPSFPGVRRIDITKNRLERIMTLRQGSRRSPRRGAPIKYWLIAITVALTTIPGGAFVAQERKIERKVENKSIQKQNANRDDGVTIGSQVKQGDAKTVKRGTAISDQIVHVPDGGTVIIGGRAFRPTVNLLTQTTMRQEKRSTVKPNPQENAKKGTTVSGAKHKSNQPKSKILNLRETPSIIVHEEEELLVVGELKEANKICTYQVKDLLAEYQKTFKIKDMETVKKVFLAFAGSIAINSKRQEKYYELAKNGKVIPIPTAKKQSQIDWHDTNLVVNATQDQHNKLSRAIAIWRKHGFDDTFVLDTVVISGSKELAKELGAISKVNDKWLSTTKIVEASDLNKTIDLLKADATKTLNVSPRITTVLNQKCSIATGSQIPCPAVHPEPKHKANKNVYRLMLDGYQIQFTVVPGQKQNHWILNSKFQHSKVQRIKKVGFLNDLVKVVHVKDRPSFSTRQTSFATQLNENQLFVLGSKSPVGSEHEFDILLVSLTHFVPDDLRKKNLGETTGEKIRKALAKPVQLSHLPRRLPRQIGQLSVRTYPVAKLLKNYQKLVRENAIKLDVDQSVVQLVIDDLKKQQGVKSAKFNKRTMSVIVEADAKAHREFQQTQGEFNLMMSHKTELKVQTVKVRDKSNVPESILGKPYESEMALLIDTLFKQPEKFEVDFLPVQTASFYTVGDSFFGRNKKTESSVNSNHDRLQIDFKFINGVKPTGRNAVDGTSIAKFKAKFKFRRNKKTVEKSVVIENGTNLLFDVSELYSDKLQGNETMLFRVTTRVSFDESAVGVLQQLSKKSKPGQLLPSAYYIKDEIQIAPRVDNSKSKYWQRHKR